MIMSIHALENQIAFMSEYVNILEVENKNLYVNIVQSIFYIMEGLPPVEPIYLFNSKGEEVSFHKNVLVFYEPFNIDANNKKNLIKLYQDVGDRFKENNELRDIFDQRINDINRMMLDIVNEYQFTCVHNSTPDIMDYLKMVNLKIDEQVGSSILVRLLTLIELIATFRVAQVIILANFKAYYTETELVEIYKYAKYQKVNILLIEPVRMKGLLQYECKLTVDIESDEFIEKSK